jgi:hypothetical protein
MKTKSLLIYQCVPLFMVLLPFVWFGIVGNDIALKREAGIIENMTVIFLLVSIGFCISAFFKANKMGLSKNLKTWLVILIAGAAYFALEEISYGQHMFGWGTADTWKEFNDQGETNLHNVHPLFDQLPRTLLTLTIRTALIPKNSIS